MRRAAYGAVRLAVYCTHKKICQLKLTGVRHSG